MARIRAIVQPELGWDDTRWQAEEKSYTELWHTVLLFQLKFLVE